MHRVRLVNWNALEAAEKAEILAKAGYLVSHEPLNNPAARREIRSEPPAAVVIDLNRLPSHGRDVALALRQHKPTRHVPLVFVDGEPEKVSRIKQVLPDAVCTTWKRLRGDLKKAIAHPPVNPRVPSSVLEGYSGTPLPKKLGIKPQSRVALFGAPADFSETLGSLPEGVSLSQGPGKKADLGLWFVKSLKELETKIDRFARTVFPSGLWIIWPKKASAMASDVSETEVRKLGLAAGLVDYKVCAVDATWSGLKFARKSAARTTSSKRSGIN